MTEPYAFSQIEPHIIGPYTVDKWFHFVIYSDKAPYKGDIIQIGDNLYKVDAVFDVTDDDEFDEGLSYSKVYMELCENDSKPTLPQSELLVSKGVYREQAFGMWVYKFQPEGQEVIIVLHEDKETAAELMAEKLRKAGIDWAL